MNAAAELDPRSGTFRGWAAPAGGVPAWVSLRIDGEPVWQLPASGPVTALLGHPALFEGAPDPHCAFSLRIPRRVADALPGAVPVACSLRRAGDDADFFRHRFATLRELKNFTEGAAMAGTVSVEIGGLRQGILHGTARIEAGAVLPDMAVCIDGAELGPVEMAAGGSGAFRFEMPAEALDDGLRMIEVVAKDSGRVLARHPLVAGRVDPEHLLVELASLRAEVDELRRALFRAGAEPALPASERPLLLAELIGHVETMLAARDAAGKP